MTTIGILGAGKLGVVLAQLALKQGFAVHVAGSGDPAKIDLTMSVLAPGSTVGWAKDVIAVADVVILALPLSKIDAVPAGKLQEKLVIDAMNYWWEVDGREISDDDLQPSSTEYVKKQLELNRVVKAFNHMGYHDLSDFAAKRGTPGRFAIAVAGDVPADVRDVAELVDVMGFDPVILPSLHAGKQLEPGHPAFGAAKEKGELTALLEQSS